MELAGQFSEVYRLIVSSRERAFQAVNKELIQLYWEVGRYIHSRVESAEWGKGVVKSLADFILKHEPSLRGFSSQNLWRMKQFYEAYGDNSILSPVVRELSWTNNLVILARTKTNEEREFYLRLAIRERYSKRELERQISSAAYERSLLGRQPVPGPIVESPRDLSPYFKEAYVLDFLDVPEAFQEKDLQAAILGNLKQFILELGRDFAFVGEEYRVQVGMSDFFIDLLFFHRELQCLVAIDLKIDKFKPEFVGKMNFYLEALDRQVKKPHENPSVGIVLVKDKDNEVVEYTLNRNVSPTLVAQYQTQLIPKEQLRLKLQQMFEAKVENPLS